LTSSLSTAHLPALAALGASAPPLRAVYSRSEKSAADLAQAASTVLNLPSPPSIYFDGDSSTNLDTLLARNDISSVIVVLPITTQPAIILKALAAGKHVISEKPVAPDVQSGLKLIADYNSNFKSKNLIWRVAENFEAEPGYRAAAAAIRAGKIGQVQSFKAEVLNYVDTESKWYKTPWRTIPDVSTSVRTTVVPPMIRLFSQYQGGFLVRFSHLYHDVMSILFPLMPPLSSTAEL
jgi:predicted dehydrogenase